METIAVAIPLLSMSSSDFAGDHCGGRPPERRDASASAWSGGM
jgi:hypothetical protein